jgi:protein SCO1/2
MRAALILALVACSSRPPEHRAIPVANRSHQPQVERAIAPAPTGPSIYELDIALHDAAGDTVRLDVDRGHTTLVSMFYGSCAAACPALIDEVGRILDAAPDTRVLLVSFDPARDTPARLRDLAREHHLDARWTLAAAADPRPLAAVLGIKYRALANGEFFHSSVLTALDPDGRPLARMDGLGNHAAIVAALGR